MNSPATQEKAVNLSVLQTPTSLPVSNRTVLDVCSYTKQHSKGLLTPCRQVGLSRKSPRNSVSPSRIDIHPSSTPKRLRVCPSLRNSKGLCKFNVNVFDTHTHEEETSEVLEKRINLEENEKANQYKHEMEEELICNKHDEGFKEEKQTGNFNNNSQHGSTGVLSCMISDIQGNLNYECNMMSTENVDGEMSTEKAEMGNLIDAQKWSVESCKILGFNSISLNDANSVIISKGTNGGTAIKANQVKNLDTQTEQFHVHTPFYKDSNVSNSSNEDSMTKSGRMIECTEQNFKILKQQITVKEEEVKRLKLILMYKKKHDVNELAIEIARWKEGCQEALRRLHKASVLQGYQLSMTQLLEMYGIAPELVGYNTDTEDFD